jgi:hypothetical protein
LPRAGEQPPEVRTPLSDWLKSPNFREIVLFLFLIVFLSAAPSGERFRG